MYTYYIISILYFIKYIINKERYCEDYFSDIFNVLDFCVHLDRKVHRNLFIVALKLYN